MRIVPRSGCDLATLASLFLFVPAAASAQDLRATLASLAQPPVMIGAHARPARACASVVASTHVAKALAALAAGVSDTIFAQGFDYLGGQCLTPNDCPDAPTCAIAACSDGFCGQATACAFGCDAGTGACADLVPANQASAHTQAGDVFTCAGSQSASLGSIAAPANAAVVIDTQTQTITVNGTAVTGIKWGVPYTPTGSGTNAVVAHVQSVTLGDGGIVTITGANALILLVDQNVDATGTAFAPTVINAAANLYTAGGPGAPSATAGGAGGAAASFSSGAGGGAGHGAAGGKGGGGNNVTTGGGTAGASYTSATEILEAGEGGGAGNALAAGGRGGGGVQISACGAVSFAANVIVNASGGGGRGGTKSISAVQPGNGGGGGGAGGTLILEASSFSIAGALVSNGGGGGGGGATSAGSNGTDGQNWSTGTPVTTAAQGGTTPGVVSKPGAGGSGGAGIVPQGADGANAGANLGGGAGGGACGAIVLNVPPGSSAPTVGAASPNIRTSTACVTQGGVPPVSCTYP